MRTFLAFLVMVTLMVPALLLVGCQPGEEAGVEEEPSRETATPAMSDEDMLREMQKTFDAAWSAGDAKTMAALWAADGDSIGPDGSVASGRAEIENGFAEILVGMYKGTTMSGGATSIRFIQPDVALVDGTFEISGIKGADGKDMPNEKGMFTDIVVKQGDQWQIACSRPMVPVKAAGST